MALLPTCAIGIVATAELTNILSVIVIVFADIPLFAVIAPDALIVVADIPPFAVITPDILAPPTISREAVGVALPIPMRATPPPTKYKLLATLAFVPNCAIGVVDTPDLASIFDVSINVADIPLFAEINSDAIIDFDINDPLAVKVPRASIVEADNPAFAFSSPEAVIVVADMPFVAVIKLDASIVVVFNPPSAFIIPNVRIDVAVNPAFAFIIPEASIVDDDIPPLASINLPRGTKIPLFAVINPLAVIVVALNPLLAVIAPDALIVVADIPPFAVINPDILALPTISSDAVGVALPMPTRATPPPTKYKLFTGLTFVPNCAIGVVAVSVVMYIILVEFTTDAFIVPAISALEALIPPFAVIVLPSGTTSPPFAFMTPEAFINDADMPPFAVKSRPDGNVIPPFAFINPDAIIVDADIPPRAITDLPKGTSIPPAAFIKPDALIEAVDIPPSATNVFPKDTNNPPLAVINPDTLALPTTSMVAVGAALPIPMRATEPPYIYMLFATFVFVPY